MHLEDLNTRIRDKGLDMILEVKPKESNNAPKHPWVQRIVWTAMFWDQLWIYLMNKITPNIDIK